MAKDSKKLLQVTTPAGIARYPRLNKPETEVNGKTLDKPRFKVGLVLNEADKGVAEFKALLEKHHAAAVAAAEKARKADPKRKNKPLAVNPVYRPVLDDGGNEIEGQFEITAKTNAEDKDGNPKVVRMFDAAGKPTRAKIGGGSRLVLSLALDGYDSQMGAGLSLYLQAVQILELREFGAGNAEQFGFKAQEGYTADESTSGNADEDVPDDAATGGEEQAPARTKGDF